MHFYCSDCKKVYPMDTFDYHCECGGLFKLHKEVGEEVSQKISIGEMETPMLKSKLNNMDVYFKLDYLRPTGSFKDRGAFVLINQLKEMGISEIVEDSSGNAGAAIAAYCAAAGIKCSIYLKEDTSLGKIKQIGAYGADLIKVPGSRDDVSAAILAAATHTYYASHVYNPLFFEGTKSLAYEIYDQVGVPDYIFVPTGNGTMLLGLYIGFKEIGKLPRLIAVQSQNCQPIYNKFHGLPATPVTETAAEGIAIGKPMRITEIIEAIKDSKGDIITVADDGVVAAQKLLAKQGIYIEVTSGSAIAGVLKYFATSNTDNKKIVIPLTGFGLKK